MTTTTAIITAEATTLTFDATEAVSLSKMGSKDPPIKVKPGAAIGVGPGVYKVESTGRVGVSVNSAATNINIQSTNTKEVPFPDQTNLAKFNLNSTAVADFFLDGRSADPAPDDRA